MERFRFIIPIIAIIFFFGLILACNGTGTESTEGIEEIKEYEEDTGIGLSESLRKKAFYELVEIQDSVSLDDPEWAEKQAEAYRTIAKRYGITIDEMREIAIEGVEKNWPMPEIEMESQEGVLKEESEEKNEEEIKETINYKIIYTDQNARYDNGVGFYVLLDSVDITDDKCKSDIKNIIKELVGKEGNNISINFFDHIKALENDYNYYVKGEISLLDDPDYLEYERNHYIAGYDGNLETGFYLNTLYFFYPDGTSDIIEFNPY